MKVSKFLHEHRAKAGIVEFNNDELYFQFDDQQNVTGIIPYPSYDANDMIEEYMLFAGMSVASNILQDVDPNVTPVLLRVNPAPDPDDLKKLKFLMDLTGHSIDGTSQLDMLSLFKAVETKYSDNVLKKKAALRMIQRISRRATYEALPSNFDEFSHYGIHAAYYTHFTSPIRRYPDLMVHRILTAKLQGLPSPYTVDEVCDITNHLNRRLSDSSRAEEDSRLRIIETYIDSKPFFTDAVVVSINKGKIFLFLDVLFKQVNANINEFIGNSEWQSVESNSAISTPALPEPLRLMDIVHVQVRVIAHTLVPVLVPFPSRD
jgi:exoribonuclease R